MRNSRYICNYYQEDGFESRQVIDFIITVHVTEYGAQILIGSSGGQLSTQQSQYYRKRYK